MTAPIQTARLDLRFAEVADAQAIFDTYASDPQATRFLAFPTLTHVDQAALFLQHACRDRESGKSITWVITLHETGVVIGAIDLRIDGRVADIGYAIGRRWWGHGFVPEAARAVLEFAMNTLGMERVTGMCDAANQPSARVFEKLGFSRVPCDKTAVHPNIGPEARPVLCFELALLK